MEPKTEPMPDWSQLPQNNLKLIGATNRLICANLEIKDRKYRDAKTSITEGLKFVNAILRDKGENGEQLLRDAKKLKMQLYLLTLSIPPRALTHKAVDMSKEFKFALRAQSYERTRAKQLKLRAQKI